MKTYLYRLPLFIVLAAIAVLAWHGPVPQLAHYHEFADTRTWIGIPHAADVLSNLGFLLAGAVGLASLPALRRDPSFAHSWPAYAAFFLALVFTAFGSGYYHLSPDNDRLLWDRLPIALACASLLAAVRSETVTWRPCGRDLLLLGLAAIASVAWWYFTEARSHGDLRPYLLLQALPLVLIPLWHALYGATWAERRGFAIAIMLYLLAKAAELGDLSVLGTTAFISGHTLKHLLAGAGAATIVACLVWRARHPSDSGVTGFNVSALQSWQDLQCVQAGAPNRAPAACNI